MIKSWVASITTILHTTAYDVVTIRPVPPRQYIPCKDNTAIPGNSPILGKNKEGEETITRKIAGKQRGGCRTAAKASWLGVLSPSLREIASAPLGTRPCCPLHKSSAWKCGVKQAVRNFSWEPFDESSARIFVRGYSRTIRKSGKVPTFTAAVNSSVISRRIARCSVLWR